MIDLTTVLFEPDTAKSDILFNVGMATSPFTGGVQTTELPGARWNLTFGYSDLDIKYSRKLMAIIAMCRGGAVVAHIHDLSYVARRDNEPGVPLVGAAGQSGIALATTGWTPNTAILELGDQISYLSTDGMFRMHIVTGNVTSDASGNASVPILPPMRNPPVAGTSISSINPIISCNLTDAGGGVSINGNVVSSTLIFTEALYGIQ